MPAPGVLLLIFILFLQFFLAAERIYNVTLCLVPLVQLNVNILPDMLKNIGLSAGLMVQSTNLLVSRIVECTTPGQNMRCFADANYLTLDLMTPSQYLRETVMRIEAISHLMKVSKSPRPQ